MVSEMPPWDPSLHRYAKTGPPAQGQQHPQQHQPGSTNVSTPEPGPSTNGMGGQHRPAAQRQTPRQNPHLRNTVVGGPNAYLAGRSARPSDTNRPPAFNGMAPSGGATQTGFMNGNCMHQLRELERVPNGQCNNGTVLPHREPGRTSNQGKFTQRITPPDSPPVPVLSPNEDRPPSEEEPLLVLLRAAELILAPLIAIEISSGDEDGSPDRTLSPPESLFADGGQNEVEHAGDTGKGNRPYLPSPVSDASNRNQTRNQHSQPSPSLAEGFGDLDLGNKTPDFQPNHHQGFETLGSRQRYTDQFLPRGEHNNYMHTGGNGQVRMASNDLSHPSTAKRRRKNYHQEQIVRFSMIENQKRETFSIFQEFLKKPELTLILAKHLRIQELLILYRTSKGFHDIVNMRFTTVVMAQAHARAPQSAKIFPFRCYANLCIQDPALRPHPVTERAAAGEARKVPSFRWLQMICFREMVCHQIITILAEDGVPVPDRCESTMKKIWFLMDIPDNARRIGMVMNNKIFTDEDLFFATLFFVKLDMRFTDPVTGSGKDGMRRMLLSQPSLSTLWRTLRRTTLISKLDVMKMYARWKYQPRPDQRGQSVFGIPPEEVGIMQYQGWGRTGNRIRLQRPDELLLKESIRRKLELQTKYTDMFLWGYINPRTMENFEPVTRRRELESLEGLEKDLIPREDRDKEEAKKLISYRVRGD
ncbi:hypothetical protein FQN50_000520 [Emmonsiellopsis sp. PD_5]|nr:hypothetical protein FQN50_000520 [Emmonsiellopsis sp. PD_5]